jgi:hypothetical protein
VRHVLDRPRRQIDARIVRDTQHLVARRDDQRLDRGRQRRLAEFGQCDETGCIARMHDGHDERRGVACPRDQPGPCAVRARQQAGQARAAARIRMPIPVHVSST